MFPFLQVQDFAYQDEGNIIQFNNPGITAKQTRYRNAGKFIIDDAVMPDEKDN